jgi:hypothetical protein
MLAGGDLYDYQYCQSQKMKQVPGQHSEIALTGSGLVQV